MQDMNLLFALRQELADDFCPDKAVTARDQNGHGSPALDTNAVETRRV
jgi:hypothetical protein